MQRRLIFGFLTLFLVLAACGSAESDSRVDHRASLGAPPEHGLRVVLPEVTVSAASERLFCYYTTPDLIEDQWVVSFQGLQNQGHHLAGFINTAKVADGTLVDCDNAELMTDWLPLFASADGHFEMPAGLATKLPAGKQLVIQSHYINASDEDWVTRDAIDLTFIDPSAQFQPAAPWGTAHLSFQIPGDMQDYTARYRCEVPQALNVAVAYGHMHEWGTSLSMATGAPGATKEFYRADPWDPSYRDDPPVSVWDTAHPLQLAKGDVLEVSCTWKSDHALAFPQEMCVGLYWVYPAETVNPCGGVPF